MKHKGCHAPVRRDGHDQVPRGRARSFKGRCSMSVSRCATASVIMRVAPSDADESTMPSSGPRSAKSWTPVSRAPASEHLGAEIPECGGRRNPDDQNGNRHRKRDVESHDPLNRLDIAPPPGDVFLITGQRLVIPGTRGLKRFVGFSDPAGHGPDAECRPRAGFAACSRGALGKRLIHSTRGHRSLTVRGSNRLSTNIFRTDCLSFRHASTCSTSSSWDAIA